MEHHLPIKLVLLHVGALITIYKNCNHTQLGCNFQYMFSSRMVCGDACMDTVYCLHPGILCWFYNGMLHLIIIPHGYTWYDV